VRLWPYPREIADQSATEVERVSLVKSVRVGFTSREPVHSVILADLDENIIRRSLPFGVGAVETHASENLILHDSDICDYSDKLLARLIRERAPERLASMV
jgi:hypothetical protein